MKRIIVATLLLLQASFAFGQKSGSLVTLTYGEFDSLPENAQALYIAGVIEGEHFIMFGIDDPRRAEFVDCVRATSLGQLANEVKAYVKQHPEDAKYPVAWSLSKVIGARRPCPHR